MAYKANFFTSGSVLGDGVDITIPNSDDTGEEPFSAINFPGTGGYGRYDNGNTPAGLQWAGEFQSIAASSPTMVAMADTASNDFVASPYMWIPSFPPSSGTVGIRSQTSAAGQGAKGFIDTAGKIQIVGGFGTTTSTGLSVPTSSWFRLQLTCDGNGTTANFSLAWYDLHSSTASDSITVNSAAYTLDCAEIRYGNAQSALGSNYLFRMAAIQQNIGSPTPLAALTFGVVGRSIVSPSLAAQQGSRW